MARDVSDAISVHKAQGAEFAAVVIPLVTNHALVLGGTLLYAALTRTRHFGGATLPEH